MLVFNGEIYNFRELREELRGAGATFHTDGDSEVILAAWQRWGPDCLPRLHGMFAFAIYDLDQRTLFLARDRMGVKPLFYAPLSDGSIAFASELKGLTAAYAAGKSTQVPAFMEVKPKKRFSRKLKIGSRVFNAA